MNYRMVHDDIDPDVVPDEDEAAQDSGKRAAGEYLIGEDGRQVVNIELSVALAKEAQRSRSWLKPMAAVLCFGFLGMTAWNVFQFTHPASAIPKPTPFQLKQALYLGVLRIEAYKKTQGAPPSTLTQAGLPENAGYEYKRLGTANYRLAFESSGPRLQYESTVSLDNYFGSPKAMLAMGGSQ